MRIENITKKFTNRIQKVNFILKQKAVQLNSLFPHDTRDTVILTGAPRSGTTWLGEILNTIPRSAVLFEPLHLRNVHEARKAGFEWVTLLDETDDCPEKYEFMKKAFTGKLINNWTAREIKTKPFKECLTVETWIVKFVRANLILDWLVEQFPIRRPLLIIRHPCAVVASQIRREWRYRINMETLRNEPLLKRFPHLAEKLDGLESIEQYLAAKWCFDYYYPLLKKEADQFELVIYENLVKNGKEAIKKIFSALEMKVPEKAYSQLRVPSLTAHHGDPWIEGPLLGWTKVFNKKQVKLILDVVEKFGMNFYTDALEPDYYRLETNSHPIIETGR